MSEAALRSIKDSPFCWQSKATRRLIRERFAELNCVSSALSIYDALCEIASDEKAEVFRAATPAIAATAGVGTRTAQSILPKLEAIGVIDIAEQTFPGTNMDAPSIYTLLKLEAEPTKPRNGCVAVSNDCAPLRNGRKQTSLRTSEESGRNSEESQEETPSSPAAPGLRISHGLVDSIYQQYPRKKQPSSAHRAIRKALSIVAKRGTPDPVAWLTDRVQMYAKSRAGEDQQFTPYPATWFNAGSYDEDFSVLSHTQNGTNTNLRPARCL